MTWRRSDSYKPLSAEIAPSRRDNPENEYVSCVFRADAGGHMRRLLNNAWAIEFHDREAPKALARAVTFLDKNYGPARTQVR